jgi:hypothetical protein
MPAVPTIPGHQGYTAFRLPGGRLSRTAPRDEPVSSYVAACECGWVGKEVTFPTRRGNEACKGEWYMAHALPLLGTRPLKERR